MKLYFLLLLSVLCIGPSLARRGRRGVGAEHFFRGKLFYHHHRHNLLGSTESQINSIGDPEKVSTLWLNQTLDHFTPSDTRTWKQRYYVNDQFYKPGGPVFLMIGGEGEATSIWMTNGAWITYAKELNALCFQLEHRFYGKSHPLPDLSLESLKYLSSQQALADLASFTVAMKSTYNLTDNKFVAFGGSYPGSLAAWYRLKYPHLVDIAVSTSAPLLAQLNFKDYLGVVRDSIDVTNSQCNQQIQKAVKSTEGLLRRRTGWWMIRKNFKLCDDFDGSNQKDVASLFEALAGNFEDIVQYNEDNRAFEGSKTANITIKTLCDIMVSNDTEETAFEKFAKVNDLMLNVFERNCTDFKYLKSVKDMQETKWDSSAASGERQCTNPRTYQTCNEFGFFQSSDLVDQPFGNLFSLNYSVRLCKDVYGKIYDQNFIENAIEWSNAYYGARDIKVTRVIFVNGSIDPWHKLGITSQNQTSSENVVIFINGTAHCANMYPDAESDIPALKAARQQILHQLTEWLNN
ncbi:putative serine protease K12H4.7 [Orchesella cincta]|uniref:Putative serine protease K12H4.7 n=1 Tax=Orchesella cincta TaxID=48709 RepID=A0A1D2MJX2_ORCCI|nr:putative serine protease K12H4.7 [Orchesella cincta]